MFKAFKIESSEGNLMQEIMIEARNVIKDFKISRGIFKPKDNLRAVDNVSIKVKRGEVIGIVGESGCGKTTFSKILMGLLPATSGYVNLCGKPVYSINNLERANLVQPIFQDPYSSLNPRKTIGSIITLPVKVQGNKDLETSKKQVLETMDLVGLQSRMYDQYPNQLSGGQRQRVAIARALINRPEVVVCDEPTSALDVSVQSQILNLLNDLRKNLNLTYIIISHNLAVVEHMATRVAVMYFGKMVEESDTDTIFTKPKHAYTKKLLSSVLTPDPRKGIPKIK